MPIFDLNKHPDEYQLFEFRVEQKYIDKWLLDRALSPLQFALMDFLSKYDESARPVLYVDQSNEKYPAEQKTYKTEIESKAFQVPEDYVYEANDYEAEDIEKKESIVLVPRFQNVKLKHDEQLDAWINQLNQMSDGIPDYEPPGPIDVQLKVKMSSPYGELSVKSKTPKSKRGNDLDGKTWLKYSISVWSDLRKTKDEVKLKHPAMFPSDLARRLIECFATKESRLVFDPFVGVGSTLVAAKELGKDAVGIEISPEFVTIANSQVDKTIPYQGETDIKIHVADSRELCKYIHPNSVDMVITSPPYWDILLEKRTADSKAQRDYGDAEADLGKIRDYEKFLLELRKIFAQVYDVMKPNSYCCVIVMDLRKKNRFYPYHMQVTQLMEGIGFIFDDMIIWDRGQEYNNLRPLGYPTVFRINRIHEFILIFQKSSECIQ